MDNHSQSDPTESPDRVKALLDSISPPPGRGSERLRLTWPVLLLFVPYLTYMLLLLPIAFPYWVFFAYSIVLIVLDCLVMSIFNEHIGHISNPFDFVNFEFINLLNAIVAFGLAYFFLSKMGDGHFNHAMQVFDAVYFSFVTIATLGYGDIHPVSPLAKSLVIFEIIVGLLFFVTIIPVAVADQAERIRNVRIGRQKLADSLRASHDRGELKVTRIENDSEV